MENRVHNFNAGPSKLPLDVLKAAHNEFVTFPKAGMSVMEMSHRSKDFEAILDRAESGIRRLLGLPDDYAVLFLGGGASLQFSMIPMNIYQNGKPVDFIHTGSWTGKALKELKKTGEVNIAGSSETDTFTRIPKLNELKLNSKASYIYLCSNNTIAGTEWFNFPKASDVPIVADMSSDILSRPFDVKPFGLIFAGAQKNLGPAGVTVVIIRKDLADRAPDGLPTMLDYRTHIKNRSLYNTPPAYPIYMIALIAEWIEKNGGLVGIEKHNIKKADLLYGAIDKSDFYSGPIRKDDRSRMNVVFRIKNGDEELETAFVKEAKSAGLIGLKGHRSVGGLRASIYNAQTIESVQALVDFMTAFEKKNGN